MTEKEAPPSYFEEANKQALKEIPKKWYEHPLLIIGVSFGVMTLADLSNIFGSPFGPNFVGGALYALSAIADEASTMNFFSVRDKYTERGASSIIKEREHNPHLSHVESAADYRKAWKKRLALDGFGFVASTLLPNVGAGVAAGKLLAAKNNNRLATRYNRALEIAINR